MKNNRDLNQLTIAMFEADEISNKFQKPLQQKRMIEFFQKWK